MKKILGSIVFIGGFVGILFILSIFIKPKEDMNGVVPNDRKVIDYKQDDVKEYDIFFFGDSESYSSFIPATFWKRYGITSYNFGTSGARVSDASYLIHEAFEKGSAKYVVVETNMMTKFAGEFRDFDDKVNDIVYRLFPAIQYHNRWKSVLNPSFLFDKKRDESVDRGYVYRKGIVPYKGGEWMEPRKKKAKLGENVEDYIRELKAFVESKGATMILVTAPSPICSNKSKHDVLEQLAKDLSLQYIDLNYLTGTMGIDWEKDTRDGGNHLNFYGARKVSNYLGKYFSKKMKIENKKNKAEYSNWNDWLTKLKYKP